MDQFKAIQTQNLGKNKTLAIRFPKKHFIAHLKANLMASEKLRYYFKKNVALIILIIYFVLFISKNMIQ
jgi:hypothetical protein